MATRKKYAQSVTRRRFVKISAASIASTSLFMLVRNLLSRPMSLIRGARVMLPNKKNSNPHRLPRQRR